MHARPQKSIRILIVDDHAILSAGLRMIIEGHPDMLVVGEATNRAGALALTAAEAPNIILLDIDLGDENGLDLLPELLRANPRGRVLLLTGVRDTAVHRRAVQLGATGLVLKEKAVETVLKAIEKVHAGEVWLDRRLIANILSERVVSNSSTGQNAQTSGIDSLTEREREVVQLIGKGLQNKAIAKRLVISEATVRHHLTSIFAKLGVNDRFELVVFIYRYGLADPPK